MAPKAKKKTVSKKASAKRESEYRVKFTMGGKRCITDYGLFGRNHAKALEYATNVKKWNPGSRPTIVKSAK